MWNTLDSFSLIFCVSELAVECITMPTGQNASSAKHQEILVRIIN